MAMITNKLDNTLYGKDKFVTVPIGYSKSIIYAILPSVYN